MRDASSEDISPPLPLEDASSPSWEEKYQHMSCNHFIQENTNTHTNTQTLHFPYFHIHYCQSLMRFHLAWFHLTWFHLTWFHLTWFHSDGQPVSGWSAWQQVWNRSWLDGQAVEWCHLVPHHNQTKCWCLQANRNVCMHVCTYSGQWTSKMVKGGKTSDPYTLIYSVRVSVGHACSQKKGKKLLAAVHE